MPVKRMDNNNRGREWEDKPPEPRGVSAKQREAQMEALATCRGGLNTPVYGTPSSRAWPLDLGS